MQSLLLGTSRADEREQLYVQFRDKTTQLIDGATTQTELAQSDLLEYCHILCRVLQHGFIERRSWTQVTGLWDFVCSSLAGTKRFQPLLETVATLMLVKVSLLQQLLGPVLQTLAESDLTDWYHEWAILRDDDKRVPIVAMTTGLSRLRFDIEIKEESPSMIQLPNLMSTGDSIKNGLSATVDTIKSVGSQVTFENVLPFKFKESFHIQSDDKLHQRVQDLQDELQAEREVRKQLEIKLVSVQMEKDRELAQMRKYMSENGTSDLAKENEQLKKELQECRQLLTK
ncbi:hypothetical protein EDD86DRAFT_274736 [Gorgonomyces haynaldii]|nr:hypothetical protein EDD86DRAFT_274736 [Gorgonomyces haynaldii]